MAKTEKGHGNGVIASLKWPKLHYSFELYHLV